ncbi:ABC transporter permease [Pusillimonas sp.]|uniref:ABC transporter permease n=1 Tax=Pusillimonas sp. TaxID=3040095 RepID=UPI0037CB5BA7
MRKLFSLILFAVAWQLVTMSGVVSQTYLPSVDSILRAGWEMTLSGELVDAEIHTLTRALLGGVLSVALGLVMALFAARIPVLARMWAPLVEIIRSIPPAAIVPLGIFALGLTPTLFIGVVVFAGFSTVYIPALRALSNTEPIQVYMARTLGYGPVETLLRVRLPAAWPEIFTGIRVTAGMALIAAVASEMLAGKDGLGFLLFDTAFSLRTSEMFAAMLVAALNGILLNQIVMWLRRPFAGWQDALSKLGNL